MAIRVLISGDELISEENRALLSRAAVQTLAQVQAFAAVLQREEIIAEVELTLLDDAMMQDINRRERNIDESTDVLSFPLLKMLEGELEEELCDFHLTELDSDFPILPLGAIVISIPRAARQAEAYGHSMSREICFLFVHGLLHLLGYDHQSASEEAVMRESQRAVMARLKLERGENS